MAGVGQIGEGIPEKLQIGIHADGEKSVRF